MENGNFDESKERSVSTTSSSSITEFVNEAFEESELELSKVVSINTSDVILTNNPLTGLVTNRDEEIKAGKNMQDFSDMPQSDENAHEFVPRGFRKMYLASLVVLMFAVCMGITAAYSATATNDMKEAHSSLHPTKMEVTWIGSLVTIGALIGGTAGGYFSNSLGRKGTLVFNSLPYVFGWLLIAHADSIALIYVGRVITGFSCGIVSVATPMYLVEISTPEIRGLLGASFQLFVVIGVLIVSCLGAVLTWRWLAVSGAIITLLSAVLMLTMPESPRWLMSCKRREEASHAITFLQGESFDTESECQALEEEIRRQPVGRIQLKEFVAPTVYKPFVLSILLMFFQQFSGINAVLFYTVDIFRDAKVSLPPITATIILSVVQVLATLLSSVLMDRAGRRPLLLISGVCMALSLFVFGGYDFGKSKDITIVNNYGWLPIVCLTSYIAAFSIGFGPTPWLMVAEMTPARFRSIVSGVATALNWTFAFVITKTYDGLKEDIQGYGVYWFYGSFCLLSLVMSGYFLPETKGKKMPEIEEYFSRK